jgi:cytochrome c
MLAGKIINGGSGNWGDISMSAHPDLGVENAKRMVEFILNLSAPVAESLPLEGTYKIANEASDSRSVYVLKAAYTDKGASGTRPVSADQIVVLRNPLVKLSEIPIRKGSMNVKLPATGGEIEIIPKQGDFLAFSKIDLTGLSVVEFSGKAAGTLEIRMDSPDGKLLAKVDSLAGKSSPGAPSDKMSKFTMDISGQTGIHDVYFILKEGKSFMIQNQLHFFQDRNIAKER